MNQVPFDLFVDKVKEMVVSLSDFKEINIKQIKDDAPMVANEGILPLDSLDILEVTVKIHELFQLKINNASSARPIFRSFATLARFIYDNADSTAIDRFIRMNFMDPMPHPL